MVVHNRKKYLIKVGWELVYYWGSPVKSAIEKKKAVISMMQTVMKVASIVTSLPTT